MLEKVRVIFDQWSYLTPAQGAFDVIRGHDRAKMEMSTDGSYSRLVIECGTIPLEMRT